MNGFWDFLVRPALEAVQAREIVEVGAEGGRHTVRLLEWCVAHRARLHVIEPEPRVDVSELAAAYPDTLVFHEAPSLEVLGALGPVDAVLLDGDHNWYTVYHELRALAGAHGPAYPLVLLHDVAWPFARRDLYYAPERIPAEHRHPYAKAGVRRGEPKLVHGDGLAPELYKAEEEGGPRNGVLTAVEDFMGGCGLALRLEVVPVDFGLGLLASYDLLDRRPGLRALLDGLSTPEFDRRLVAYAEERRIDDLVHLQREHARMSTELASVIQDLGRHQAELGRHEVEVARLRELLRDALQDAEAAHTGVRALEARVEDLRAESERMRVSRSWRLTAPLRHARALLRNAGREAR